MAMSRVPGPPLSPTAAASMLRASAAAIVATARNTPDEILTFLPGPDEWCVKDVIGHLIEAERRGFAGRIRVILEKAAPALEGWDPAEVARGRHDVVKDVETLVGELLALREAGAALVAGLAPEDFRRVGRHPKVGDLSVRDVLQEWVYHDANHLKQILSNVQAYAWPHMGNAQKFSLP
jgi:hypothetical protein